MNPIALIILLFLVAVAFAINCMRHRREECHNAEAEEPKSPPTVEEKAVAELEAMKPQAAPKGITEDEIREKVSVGLTRDQAIEVITNQRKHDALLAKLKK